MRSFAPAALLLVAMFLPTLAAWLYFDLLAGDPRMPGVYLGSKVLQGLLPLVGWFGLGMRKSIPGWKRSRGLGAGLVTGLGMAAAAIGAYWILFRSSDLLAETPDAVRLRLEAFGADDLPSFLVVAVGLSLAHSLFEEYYWRAFVFGSIRWRFRFGAAAIVSSLTFASHHVVVLHQFLGPGHLLTGTIPFAVAVALGGGIWAWLYERYGSLVAPWISHLLADAALMAIGWWLVSG